RHGPRPNPPARRTRDRSHTRPRPQLRRKQLPAHSRRVRFGNGLPPPVHHTRQKRRPQSLRKLRRQHRHLGQDRHRLRLPRIRFQQKTHRRSHRAQRHPRSLAKTRPHLHHRRRLPPPRRRAPPFTPLG